MNEYLEKQANILVDVLEQHIEDMKNDKNGYYMDDMEAKLKALKYKPSPIETTMTPLQLYKQIHHYGPFRLAHIRYIKFSV